jgi:choline-sulfatase/uncharacterized sulfatase
MGVEGHPHALTPHMDRLAREGVHFTRAYTQNPICTPSRVSILAGQYCHNHGYYGLSGPAPQRLPSFLSHFRQHGYRTAGIGKLHTPNEPRDWLLDHCELYAECYEYNPSSEESPYFAYLERLGLRDKEDSIRLPEFPGTQQDDARPSLLPFEHSVEGWCVQEAIRFIDACREQPWCMQIALPRPHQCYTPARQFWDMYPEDLPLPETIGNDASHRPPHFQQKVAELKNKQWLLEPNTFENGCRRVWRGYLALITQTDHALGLLRKHLEATGKADHTIVIYGSDHGAYSGTFGVPEKAPGICSEAVCRVPFLWRVPGTTPPGRTCHQLVENIDIAPTITALCGLPAMETTDGCDITRLLRGDNRPVREVAVTENAWSKALRWGKWRFVHYQPEMFGQDTGELYNIEDDPQEMRNLYADGAHQPIVQQCRRLLLEWLIRTTRVVTANPSLNETGERAYHIAADGKEANTAGPALRARRGRVAYL